MEGWPIKAWRMNATDAARRLAKTEEFASTWRALVVAPESLGDGFVELEGDEVAGFIEGRLALLRG
jgi:hypothetical protein